MHGSFLRFYVEERQKHEGLMLWEWLLAEANRMGIRGGSAIRAVGGFGRHRELHTDRFFEIAGSGGVEIEFVVDDEEMARLLDLVRVEGIRVFYAVSSARFGIVNPGPGEELLS